jgi:crotonobetainyl-CoA:carnitine CoA-transferase CaiB-like acyl-CoA transferase
VALTGFGLDSEQSERPAYDYVIQAMTGIMSLTGEPNGPPTKACYSAVDNSAGIMGAVGLLARLVEGKGGQVDIAMHDVMLSQLNYLAGALLNVDEEPQRQSLSAHPFIVPAQIFKTSDSWVTLFITHDTFWEIFCKKVNKLEWISDPKYSTMVQRASNRKELIEHLDDLMKTKSSKYWEELLIPCGIVVSEIKNLRQALESSLVKSRDMVVKLEDENSNFLAIGNPIKNEGYETKYYVSPLLNADYPSDLNHD